MRFPDEGLYWYHPHIREDYTQDSGLYGMIVVEPSDPGYWPPCDREVVLTIDDVLMEDGRLAPYDHAGPDHTAMGRFGNVLLVAGRPDWRMEVARGEVVRLFLVNTANTRVFNVGVSGARMKLVGATAAATTETFIEETLIAPSERAIVDVLVDRSGEVVLEHRAPDRTYELGRITVGEGTPTPAAGAFDTLRRAPELEAERDRLRRPRARARQDPRARRRDGHGGDARAASDEGPRFAMPDGPHRS